MSKEVVYDKAKYHYEGQFPNDLSIDQAFVHTGMFLGWLIDHNLISEEFEEETRSEIQKFKQREITGTRIYMEWDGALVEDMLNDEGNEFAQHYFDFEKGLFIQDYEDIFREYENLYYVEDNWRNYSKIKEVVDKRYVEWKSKLIR